MGVGAKGASGKGGVQNYEGESARQTLNGIKLRA